MTRITEIDELMFPVELRPVYTTVKINGGISLIEVPNRRAVINKTSGNSLGVVGSQYKLLTNEQAIELGKQCCADLFGVHESANIEVFNAHAPSTKTYCHIDLVHKGYVMNLWDEEKKSDVYVPYVRITNSYNTSRALRFDIGFCRRICFNGLIFESETVRFTFKHTNQELNNEISFTAGSEKITTLFNKFTTYVTKLRRYDIQKEKSLEIIHALFNIKEKSDIDSSKKPENDEEHNNLLREIDSKLVSYINEIGANGYALFNAITDIASNPIDNRYLRRDINSMQRLAGNWINSFQEEIEENEFSIESYIHSLKEASNKTAHLTTNRHAGR